MKHRSRQELRHETTDHDAWAQPGSAAALLLSSIVWVLWWIASLVVAPIRLAIRRHDDGLPDEVWGAEDRR